MIPFNSSSKEHKQITSSESAVCPGDAASGHNSLTAGACVGLARGVAKLTAPGAVPFFSCHRFSALRAAFSATPSSTTPRASSELGTEPAHAKNGRFPHLSGLQSSQTASRQRKGQYQKMMSATNQ